MPRAGGNQGKRPVRNPWEEWEKHPAPPELVEALVGPEKAATCLQAHWVRDEQVRLVFPDESHILPATARPVPREEWEAALSRVYPERSVPGILAKTKGVWRYEDKDGPRLFIAEDRCSTSVPDDPRWQEHVQRTVARVLMDSVLKKVEEIQPGGAALLRQHPDLLAQLVEEHWHRLFPGDQPDAASEPPSRCQAGKSRKPTNGGADQVFATPSGKTFHLADCRYVSTAATELSRTEAEERGLTACSACHP